MAAAVSVVLIILMIQFEARIRRRRRRLKYLRGLSVLLEVDVREEDVVDVLHHVGVRVETIIP